MAEMVEAILNGEFKITLPKHRADRPEWYTDKGWEKPRLTSLHDKIRKFVFEKEKAPIMVYVGAEEGEMAALCQMWGAKVVLAEPNEKVWSNIKAIWDANELPPPLECYVGFCGAENSANYTDGRYGMYDGKKPVDNWPKSAYEPVIHDHGFKELADPGEIPIIKIDTIPVIPDMISLDVEGSEWRVLEGARKSIESYHPQIWLSGHPEFMYHHYKEHLGDLRRWLKDFGYTETILDYQHEVHLFYEVKR